jgi:hypothetical protein
MREKKLLLASPFPDNQGMYPHLRKVIDTLSEHYTIDYFHGHERGVWLEEDMLSPLNKRFYKLLFYIITDILRLLYLRFFNHYDNIIAIDNFLYIIVASIFQQPIVLWSHDFVSYDQPKLMAWHQQLIAKLTEKKLVSHGKLIIQDRQRLQVFLRSIACNEMAVEVFIYPSHCYRLRPTQDYCNLEINSRKPIVMQIGGINSWRSRSDELINHYQDSAAHLSLLLHGFIDDEIYSLIDGLEHCH